MCHWILKIQYKSYTCIVYPAGMGMRLISMTLYWNLYFRFNGHPGHYTKLFGLRNEEVCV